MSNIVINFRNHHKIFYVLTLKKARRRKTWGGNLETWTPINLINLINLIINLDTY